MSESDPIKGEEARLRKEKQQKLAKSIERTWALTGHNPREHMRHVQHQGDAALMLHWSHMERHPTREVMERGQKVQQQVSVTCPNLLAWLDMSELFDHYRALSVRQRAQQDAT